MKILVTGDRHWTDSELIKETLEAQEGCTQIVQGGARGADRIAHAMALELGLESITVPADWDMYGKSAGVIRNQQMLDLHSDIAYVLAFHDHLEESKGTKDMVRRALKKNIPVYNYFHVTRGKQVFDI